MHAWALLSLPVCPLKTMCHSSSSGVSHYLIHIQVCRSSSVTTWIRAVVAVL